MSVCLCVPDSVCVCVLESVCVVLIVTCGLCVKSRYNYLCNCRVFCKVPDLLIQDQLFSPSTAKGGVHRAHAHTL